MINKINCILVSVFLVTFFNGCSVFADKKNISQKQSNPKEVIKEDGWLITGLKNSKKSEERRVSKGLTNEGLIVFVTNYKPEGEIEVEKGQFSGTDLQKLGLSTYIFFVEEITAYDVNEKVFCYIVEIRAKDMNFSTALFFFDSDGNGTFEIVKNDSPSSKIQIPEWAKNL